MYEKVKKESKMYRVDLDLNSVATRKKKCHSLHADYFSVCYQILLRYNGIESLKAIST